jgi:two-component system, cell cycle sensor histidine kinase and response regulator CckA
MSLALREFRLIFEGVREGVVAVEPPRIRDANPAFCALLGYSHSQLLHLRPTDLASRADRQRLAAIFSEPTAGSVPMRTIDFGLRNRQGDEVPVSLRLLQADGCWYLFARRREGALATAPNPHVRTRTLKLEESRNRYRRLVENLADGLVTLNERGEFLYINKTFAGMLGYRARSRLVARAFIDVVAEGDQDRVRRGLKRWEGGTLARFETTLVHEDGSEVPVLLSGRALEHGQDGLPAGILLLVTDFAERRALLEKLALARQMDALSSLAGGVAHDFNNLLTGILGNASRIRSLDGLDPEIDGLARGVEESAELAARLTQRLLALVRGQAPHRKLLDVSELAVQTLRLLDKVIPESIEVRTSFDRALAPVLADESQMQQALLNLCINARDAMVSAGGAGVLTISVGRGELRKPLDDGGVAVEPAVVLLVSDTGPGIPKELRTRIFDPFFTTKGLGRGIGLGLSNVYALVDAHGGTIEVGAARGGGATFTLRLPAQPGREAAPLSTPSSATHVATRGRGRILVAEDERAIRQLVAAALERQGYEVLVAEDGREALELWGKNLDRIDGMVLDVRMPHVDGTEVLRQARADRPDLPAVLSSGFIPEKTEADEMFTRVVYLPKPYRVPELLKAVATALQFDDDVIVGTPPEGVPVSFAGGDTTDTLDPVPSRPGQGFDAARTLTDAEIPSLLQELHSLMLDEL